MAREFERTLPVKLTVPELVEKGYMLADEQHTLRRLNGDKKAAAEDFKVQIEGTEEEIQRLSAIVKNKAEHRPVKCRELRDYKRAVVEVVRLDTGELVESRVMTEAERQREISEIDAPETDEQLPTAVGEGDRVLEAAARIATDPKMKAAVEMLRPKAGSSIESVTLSMGDKSVTLEQKAE